MQPLVLTHFTVVTCLGAGLDATLAGLRAGRSGLKACNFETAAIDTYIGEVPGVDDISLPAALNVFACRNNRLAHLAIGLDGFAAAVARARARYGARRIALVLGTSTSGILQTELAYRARTSAADPLPASFDYAGSHNSFSIARFLAAHLGIEGPAQVLSAACATTAKAFGSAARLIVAGLCDAAIVGGADSLCLTTLYGFRALQLTAEEPCRPFDEARSGISIGEGAGFVLLERPQSAEDVEPIRLLGIGESGDAYHMSSPHPEGVGARLAMERALAAAHLRPSDIDYVNLHGTATRIGDAAEDKAIVAVFGTDTPCSSTKGYTGHTLGAAGIVEAIIAALALKHDLIPGSPHTRAVDPAFRCQYVRESATGRLTRAMSNSFGFGGSNASLILGRS